jgi:phytoene dehydrogenase-like protein
MERAYDDAKYGNFSRHPYIDMVIPSPDRPVGRAAGQARAVLLRAVRALQTAPRLNWDDQKEAFGDTVVNTIAEYAPNIKDIILHGRWLPRSILNASGD